MKEQIENVWNGIVNAASDPKVALGVGVAVPSASSIVNKLELVNNLTGSITGVLAMLTGAVVLAIQILKFIREWRGPRRRK